VIKYIAAIQCVVFLSFAKIALGRRGWSGREKGALWWKQFCRQNKYKTIKLYNSK